MDLHEALYTTRAMRRPRFDPAPDDVHARILDGDPGTKRRQRATVAVRTGRRPGIQGATCSCLPLCDHRTLGVGVRSSRRLRPPIPTRPTPWRSSACAGRRSTSPTASRMSRCCCSRSPGSIAPEARPSPRSVERDARRPGQRRGQHADDRSVVAIGRVAPAARRPGGQALGARLLRRVRLPGGPWGVARRRPVDDVAARNGWHGPLGFTVPKPLWWVAMSWSLDADDGVALMQFTAPPAHRALRRTSKHSRRARRKPRRPAHESAS